MAAHPGEWHPRADEGPCRHVQGAPRALRARHGWLAFLLAVRAKWVRDQGSYLAAAVTYYAFLAVFPLLLVFTSGLGFALRHHSHLRAQGVTSTLGQFPVVGHDLHVGALIGSGLALAIGLAGATWAEHGVSSPSRRRCPTSGRSRRATSRRSSARGCGRSASRRSSGAAQSSVRCWAGSRRRVATSRQPHELLHHWHRLARLRALPRRLPAAHSP